MSASVWRAGERRRSSPAGSRVPSDPRRGSPSPAASLPSKSLAKIASGMDKPDGLTVVPPGKERAVLAPLPVRDLWGVGLKTAARLERAGVTTVGQLAERPLPWLIDRFGVRGEWFHQLAIGADDSAVNPRRERKSISSEATFAEDSRDRGHLEEIVREQAASVARQLKSGKLRARTVQVKLRLADFTTFTRRHTLPLPIDEEAVIATEALGLLRRELTPGRQFRLVGVGVSNLSEPEPAGQLGLFDQVEATAGEEFQHTAALDTAVARIKQRYGDAAIGWGEREP